MNMESTATSRTITVNALARVEGEGAFTIRMRGDDVEGVELRIYEPPRFYEAFLRGRSAMEAPDITARICGICPVAYQMSSVHALERIFGVRMPDDLRALRRLLYCGEWVESHTLHVYMLHAPDFLGFPGALELAKSSAASAAAVRRGLRLKKAGNQIVQVVGGREVHPINVRVGGFYRYPRTDDLAALAEELKWARDAAIETVAWTAGFQFPDLADDYCFVSMRHADEYPMNEGRLVSNTGLDISVDEFTEHFEEHHVAHSNALHARIKNAEGGAGSYLVGPLARWNLNQDRLPEVVRQAANDAGLEFPVRNPFKSIVVRSLEILLAIDEALRIIDDFRPGAQPHVDFEPKAGMGCAFTEAPRGMLYHRYETDSQGMIREAVIVPPTSQNQPRIEDDLRRLAPRLVNLPEEQAAMQAEFAIRNYDPCISCATHFLRFKVERR